MGTFTISRIKERRLELVPLRGYLLKKDTAATRDRLKYDNKKETEEIETDEEKS